MHSYIDRKYLVEILQGCKSLARLDVSYCSGFRVDDNLLELASHIHTFKYEGAVDSFSHEDHFELFGGYNSAWILSKGLLIKIYCYGFWLSHEFLVLLFEQSWPLLREEEVKCSFENIALHGNNRHFAFRIWSIGWFFRLVTRLKVMYKTHTQIIIADRRITSKMLPTFNLYT